MSGRRLDLAVALLLFLLTTIGLQLASRTQGFTRDEGYYFTAAENHAAYYEEALSAVRHGRLREPFAPRFIDRYFGYNSEHPPLMKTLFGLSWRLLHRCNCPAEGGLHPLPYPQRHRTLGLLKQGDAMRLPTHALAGLLIAAVYLFGARCWGRVAGLAAAGLTIFLPRHVFHAQLSCFDAPVAAMIFLITWAYLRAQQSGTRRWAVAAGVLLGLGLSTKHNTFFLPIVLLGHSLWVRRGRLRQLAEQPSLGKKAAVVLRYVAAPWAVAMAVLGPLVYLMLWPYLWAAPVQRFTSYLGFHLHHVHYNIEYLGQNYNKPPYPWHYVPVMTLLTTPVTTLLLAAIGTLALLRRTVQRAAEPQGETTAAPALLVALAALWPILLIMRPGTPIFGAEKHWLPAMPFLALLGGVGLTTVLRQAAAALRLTAGRQAALGAALLLVVLVPPFLETRRSHPYALSHYNLLAGGPTGGATLGMNRQFWGYAVRGIFPWLDAHAAANSAIYFHDANWNQIQMSQKDGLLRRDLYDSGIEEPGVRAADLALVIHEKHFNKYEYWIWDAFGTTGPSFVLTHEGVPIVTVYERPGSRKPSGDRR